MTGHFYIAQFTVAHVEVDYDFVSAQRIKTFDAVSRRRRQFAAIARRTVVVENDVPVEILEIRHESTEQLEGRFETL